MAEIGEVIGTEKNKLVVRTGYAFKSCQPL